MEFSLFVQGHSPKERAHYPFWEHQWLLNELELIREADQHNWKYVWVSEHHFLEEYSHLSANESFLGYCAAITERISAAA